MKEGIIVTIKEINWSPKGMQLILETTTKIIFPLITPHPVRYGLDVGKKVKVKFSEETENEAFIILSGGKRLRCFR